MDQAALDAAYNNSAVVADSQEWVGRWREKSAAIRAAEGARLDIPYGARPRARLDYFPSGAKDAPLFVFIHGGYWQRNEKDTFAFVSEGPRARGINVALPGYTLAPDVTVADIVAEIEASLTYLASHAAELGFDGKAIIVGGWSAGGHLTAAVAHHPAFRAGIPISGIFDLEPIALSYLDEKLSLECDRDRDPEPAEDVVGQKPAAASRGRWCRASGAETAVGRIRLRRQGARLAGHIDRTARPPSLLDSGRNRPPGRCADAATC